MSAPKRPTLIDPRFWQKRREHYLAVFKRALMLLRDRGPLPDTEPNLNRELHFAVNAAIRELDPKGHFGRPVFEAQNLPDPGADTVQPHEFKKPDIQWTHDDPKVADARYCEKSFSVECKRLGTTTEAGWNLNEQYVIAGIHRFRSREHRYGERMAEGAMIGYVQALVLTEVHTDVCRHAATASIPPIPAASRWEPRGVTELAHTFDREFPGSPFHLTHLWLDIQDIAVLAPPVQPGKAPKPVRPAKRPKKANPSRGR